MKRKIVLYLLIGISTIIVKAQNAMFVKNISGSQTVFAIAKTQKIMFATGDVIISTKNESSNSFKLTDLRSLTFGDSELTSISAITLENNRALTLYPNPVQDYLHVHYTSTILEIVYLQIIDIKGNIILQQSFKSRPGLNTYPIEVNQLTSGFYIVQLRNLSKIESTKFLKY